MSGEAIPDSPAPDPVFGVGVQLPDGTVLCKACGCEVEWSECEECGGEGGHDGHEEDALWYHPGEVAPCSGCNSEGGHHYCPEPACPTGAVGLVELDQKPLFIPLKREYFEAFEAGRKTWEYRRKGSRWNAETCAIGRRVTLSLGYGKGRRMAGVIIGFRIHGAPAELPGWTECYGSGPGKAACLEIRVDRDGRDQIR